MLVLIGDPILILGFKIHNFLPFFGVAPKFHSNFSQKFKNWVFRFSQKITTTIARFRALKSIFEFNVFIGYFGMFQGFKKPPHMDAPES